MGERRGVAERLIGREALEGVIETFLTTAIRAATTLVLEGPAGIGKTALLQRLVERASEAGYQVLRCSPDGGEVSYAYAALGDLLIPSLVSLEDRVSATHLEVLGIALGTTRGAGLGVGHLAEGHVVGMAVAGALDQFLRQSPLLLVIDDVPNLDVASREALRFALRRLSGRPIRIGLAVRTTYPDPPLVDLLGRDLADRATRIAVTPLSLAAAPELIRARSGITLPRPTVQRVWETGEGNPLFMLELARAIRDRRGPTRAESELAIPSGLRDLMAAHLRQVGADGAAVILAVAAGSPPTVAQLEGAIGVERTRAGLEEAEQSGLIVLADDHVRMTHPLVGSTAYAQATPADRRRVHAALARVVDDPEARARHQALATPHRDARLADALETAARAARARGATFEARELAVLAVGRTPARFGPDAARRTALVAQLMVESGDLPSAQDLLGSTIPDLPLGPDRAEARYWLATVLWYLDTGTSAAVEMQRALDEAGDDPWLRGRIELRLAIFLNADVAAARSHGAAAVVALEGALAAAKREARGPADGSPTRSSNRNPDAIGVSLATALFGLFYAEVLAGLPPRPDVLERGLAVEGSLADPDASTVPGIWWNALDRTDDARERYGAMLSAARDIGETSGEADLLTKLAEVDVWSGRLSSAFSLAEEAVAAAEQAGSVHADPSNRIRVLALARIGSLDAARDAADAAIQRLSAPGQQPTLEAAWLVARCEVAIGEADLESIVALASRSAQLLARVGIAEPLRLGLDHEHAEALAGLGRESEATLLLETLEMRQARVPRPWLEASITRTRAHLLADAGRLVDALAHLDGALDGASASGWQDFDRARTLMVKGALLRRARDRRGARLVLTDALQAMELMGCSAWAARATSELRRAAPSRHAMDGLTATETRVALLAGSGLTNREVAMRLFVSPKTVEANLSRVYAKLGIRSRAELGALVARGELGEIPVG